MYENFFNLTTAPFQNTPNAQFFFETEQHKEALAKLEYVVRQRRGFALITGEIGAGKTTLSRTLIRRLGSEARVALVNNTRVSAHQLLKLVATEFQISLPQVVGKATLLARLRQYIEQQHGLGRNVVVIIDEGQCLSIDEFEELRLLTNLETETEKLVQLLILGQPELRETLRHPRLAPLIQRVVMYMHLNPMTFDDTARYIAFRLERASKTGRPNVDFSREALQMIHEYSRGIPRLINLVADNALLIAFSNDTHLIDAKVVGRVISQMLPNFNGGVLDRPVSGLVSGDISPVQGGEEVSGGLDGDRLKEGGEADASKAADSPGVG